ncbi:MAG: hypothetical protein RLZZ142_2462 [Verrucomicrobiota bacterium]
MNPMDAMEPGNLGGDLKRGGMAWLRGRGGEPSGAVQSFYSLPEGLPPEAVCNGTACFVARHLSPQTWNEAERQSPRVYCLGQCFGGPARRMGSLRPRMEVRGGVGIVLERLSVGGARHLEEYRARGGYAGWERTLSRTPQEVVAEVCDSGLRGRGGAGFLTGRKWAVVASQVAEAKFVVANGDEGDPGACIDRYLMEEDPHALIEGMLVAAYAVGASHGWVYVRCEYSEAKRRMEVAVDEARRADLLGPHTLGRGRPFDLTIHSGAGGYVCGEETALIRSLEERRPEVMPKPPFVAERGLWGRPTLVNNVETLAVVPWVMRHGPGAYRALGFLESRGTKVICLNSLFRKPGLYEVEFGMSLQRIVEEVGEGLVGGRELRGLLVGGPLSGIVPPALLDTPFGYEELRRIGASLGHGGWIAFDAHTSIRELLRHVFAFGAEESCGKCFPCRLGSHRISEALDGALGGGMSEASGVAILEALRRGSLCGLGTGLGELGESVLRHYGKEWAACWA